MRIKTSHESASNVIHTHTRINHRMLTALNEMQTTQQKSFLCSGLNVEQLSLALFLSLTFPLTHMEKYCARKVSAFSPRHFNCITDYE